MALDKTLRTGNFKKSHSVCSWRLIVNKKIIAKQDTQLQSVLQQKNPQNFLLHQEQLTDLAPSFLCPCQKFLSKKAKFLITMRAIKSFDTIPFVSSCKFRNSCHNERPNFLTQWEQSNVFVLKSPILYMPVSLWRFIVNKQILVFVKTLYKPSRRKIFIGVFSYKIQVLRGMPEETWRQM